MDGLRIIPDFLPPPHELVLKKETTSRDTMIAIVTERGQVIIPKALREKMDIRPSCALSFSVKGDMLIAVKAKCPKL